MVCRHLETLETNPEEPGKMWPVCSVRVVWTDDDEEEEEEVGGRRRRYGVGGCGCGCGCGRDGE